MFSQSRFKQTRRAALLAAVSVALPAVSYGQSVGRVDFAIGEVTATSPDGKVRALAKGAEINLGDTVDTGSRGRAQVRFTDGAYSSLLPETRFRIDDYRYEGRTDGNEKGFFSLIKGGLRTITGAIGRVNRNAYQVTTPTATIGIRGTHYLAREVASLNVSVGEGIIEVCNAAGCLTIAEGESAFVKDAGTRPAFVSGKPVLPAPGTPRRGTPSGEILCSMCNANLPGILQGGVPPAVGLPGFVAGNEVGPTGMANLFSPLVSGHGYAMLFSFGGFHSDLLDADGLPDFDSDQRVIFPAIDKSGGVHAGEPSDIVRTFAAFDRLGVLTRFKSSEDSTGPLDSISRGTATIEGFTDGVIGWGRWVNGTTTRFTTEEGVNSVTLNPGQGFHYVVGIPTSAADMEALRIGNYTANYAMMGFTTPTFSDGYGNGLGKGTLSGALTANFATGQVGVNMAIDFAPGVYRVNGTTSPSETIRGPSFEIDALATFTAKSVPGKPLMSDCASGCSTDMFGLFIGPRASRAGIAYTIDSDNPAVNPRTRTLPTRSLESPTFDINGAAVFKQTTLVPR